MGSGLFGAEPLLRDLGYDVTAAVNSGDPSNTHLIVTTHHATDARQRGIEGTPLKNFANVPFVLAATLTIALATRRGLEETGLEEILQALPEIEHDARTVPPVERFNPERSGMSVGLYF